MLVSSVYLAQTTGTAIAAVPSLSPVGQESPSLSPNSPLNPLRPSVVPVAESTLPHSHHTAQPAVPIAAFPTFNSQQLDSQLQRYLRFVDQSGQPDILIVGSSRALWGVDPIVLQQTFASRGYPKLKIFNFGVNGATAQLVDLLLRQLLTPDQLPRFILWADGVRAFNSGRIDLTYKRAIASPGYQLLSAGIRPVLVPEVSPEGESTCVASLRQLSTHEVMSQPKYFNVVPSFDPALNQRQWCWDSLQNRRLSEDSVKLGPTPTNRQEITGFQSLSEQFKPDEYFRRYPKVQGAYDADYRDFTLNGRQTDALNNIVMFAKTRRIPVVFVNLPLTQIYLDETRTADEQQFRAYLQRFARSQPLSVHDLSQRWLHQNAYFTDPSHLNRYGAAAVANQLGSILTPPSAQP